jgi:hypothetical protein
MPVRPYDVPIPGVLTVPAGADGLAIRVLGSASDVVGAFEERDHAALVKLKDAGNTFQVTTGTHVDELANIPVGLSEVRILDGPAAGSIGWVPPEWVA